MLASRFLAWRLEMARIPAIYKSFDATNAFACGARADLDSTTLARLHRDEEKPIWQINADAELLRLRRANFCVVVACPDGPLTMHTGSGGFMGDCCEGELFTENYGQALATWINNIYRDNVRDMVVHAFSGRLGPLNGFSGTYLDDILALLPILVQPPSLAAIVRKDAGSSQRRLPRNTTRRM